MTSSSSSQQKQKLSFGISSKSLSRTKTCKTSKQTNQTSVKMKLALVLLLLLSSVCPHPYVDYNGFDHCTYNGWSCSTIPGRHGLDIIYDCSHNVNKENTRIWVWTARLPGEAERITVQNCNTVEVHMDCTMRSRESKIQEFRAINITRLIIMEPSTGELHDNFPTTHFPPLFYLENIWNTSFYRGMFHNKNNSCRYNSGNMKKMVLNRVGIENIESYAFFNDMEELRWSGVVVKSIEANAIVVNGSVYIENSHFPKLPSKAMTFSGLSVIFKGNIIDGILPDALTVFSSEFSMVDNLIGDIMTLGLSLRSTHVHIQGNDIKHLGKEAFQGIRPSFYLRDSAYKVSYEFTKNTIESMSRFSLHCNWTAYENACSKIELEGNKFDCSCDNIMWLYRYVDNKKNMSNAGFYSILLNTTHHCGTSFNCTLSSILPFACHNETTLEANCANFQERENFTSLPNKTELNIDVETEMQKEDFKNWDLEKPGAGETEDLYNSNQEKMILDNNYYKDNLNGLETSQTNFPVWIIVLIFVFLATLNALAYVIWYFKGRKSNSVDICKYERRGDSDKLIIKGRNEGTSIECENISYQD